jgi:hypothetical protein
MRSRAGQRVPVWLQMIIVVVCAAAMVIAADRLAAVGRSGTLWTASLFLSQ